MTKKIILISLLMFFLLINLTLTTTAYYHPQKYRASLLELRASERAINDLKDNLEQSKREFSLTRVSDFKAVLNNLDSLYQKQILAYQNNNDPKVIKLAAKIIDYSQKIQLKLVESKPVQLRGIWLDSGTWATTGGASGLKELLDLMAEANFNVIFAETFYKGLAAIPSNKLFKQDSRFENWKEDPLQVLIKEAKKRGIEVHAWVWVFNENTKGNWGPILLEHPNWAAKNKAGETISYHNSSWLAPANKEVKQFLQTKYEYLVKNYDLAGINLDYIRFPEEYRGSFGYDQKTVQRFKKEYNLDPFQIENGDLEFSLWNKYRENLITEMVAETSLKLKKIDPDLLVSADVIPGQEEARYRALQNWSFWLENEYLDFVLPMTYTENLFSEINQWVVSDRKAINSPLYPGISVFKLNQAQMIEQLKEVNKINPNGNSLFAAAHLTKNDYYTLAKGIYSQKAQLPNKNKNKSYLAVQNYILQRLTLIKKAEEIKNESLIKIRGYLNQLVNSENFNLKFEDFAAENDLKIKPEVFKILADDFRYLEDLKRIYWFVPKKLK